MLKRIITGAAIGAVLAVTIYLSGTWFLPILIAILSFLAVWEMGKCIGIHKNLSIFIPSLFCSVALPIIAKIFDDIDIGVKICLFVYYILLVYYFAMAMFSKGKIKIKEVVMSFATTLYITFGFTSLVFLRNTDYGQYILLFALGLPWVSDISAYFSGMLFGKHKLIPEVSPKKTVEGAVGAVIISAGLCALYCFVIIKLIDPEISNGNYIFAVVIGAIVSIVSQIGDLIASVIKREYGIKDYGWVFPGHGGVLDRFDSVLLVAPFVLALILLPFGFSVFS